MFKTVAVHHATPEHADAMLAEAALPRIFSLADQRRAEWTHADDEVFGLVEA